MRSIVYVHVILIIIPVVRWCSFIGPLWSAVFYGLIVGIQLFGNFDSTVPVDVIGMKSYMNSLLSSCIPMRVRITINKLNMYIPRFFSVLRNCGVLSTRKPYISIVFCYPFSHWSPCFTNKYFVAHIWDLVNDTVLFCWLKGVFRSPVNQFRFVLPSRGACSQAIGR